MSEDDYIICTHLARVRCLLSILGNLCAGIDGVIEQDKLWRVGGILRAWEDGLAAKVEASRDAAEEDA